MKVESELERLLEEDIIEKVESSPTDWISPIVMVPKPSGEYRLCVDMVEPNKAMKHVRHVIPTVNELRYDHNSCTIFSKLDLNQGNEQAVTCSWKT